MSVDKVGKNQWSPVLQQRQMQRSTRNISQLVHRSVNVSPARSTQRPSSLLQSMQTTPQNRT